VRAHELTSAVKTEDNHYWYDGLQQVKQHERGDLTPETGPPYNGIDPSTREQQEIFHFDETGNWLRDVSLSPSLDQTRTHNEANQITSISPTAGSGAAVQPVYDNAGNMTTMPQPSDWKSGYDCKWDAWNRLVELKDGSTVAGKYAYDALTRRITKTNEDEETTKYYYDVQWRALEERDSSDAVEKEYVYNPADRWNLIRRRRTTGETPLNETRFVLRDYLDPVAIVTDDGEVDERYSYDAFGPVRIMDKDYGPRTSSDCEWTWLFHGEFIDETGLYNYGYRYYHPQLGRWPSRDPIGVSWTPESGPGAKR
jgi:RHS repeat-associated protein